MHILTSHIIVSLTNLIHDGTHNSYEMKKHAFIVLPNYSIIFQIQNININGSSTRLVLIDKLALIKELNFLDTLAC